MSATLAGRLRDPLCNLDVSEMLEIADALEAAEARIAELMNVSASGEQLVHERSCPQLTPASDEPCTCGLLHRQREQTAVNISTAWRKRAEAAEQSLASAEAAMKERCINRLGKEYTDEERFGKDADVYNFAVTYCINALIALQPGKEVG